MSDVRSWCEPPRDVTDGWYRLAEWFRQNRNRFDPDEQVESPMSYMVHRNNFWPFHATFAYGAKSDAWRKDCRFYTWHW